MSFPTCTTSIIAGVHFSEVSVDGGALSRIVGTVQTTMTDCVKITAIWGEIMEKRRLKQRDPTRKPRSRCWRSINSEVQEIDTEEVHQGSEVKPADLCAVTPGREKTSSSGLITTKEILVGHSVCRQEQAQNFIMRPSKNPERNERSHRINSFTFQFNKIFRNWEGCSTFSLVKVDLIKPQQVCSVCPAALFEGVQLVPDSWGFLCSVVCFLPACLNCSTPRITFLSFPHKK